MQDPLEKQPGKEPPGGIVQTDDPVNMKTASAVIPGAQIVLPQEAPAEILHGEDQRHIEQSAFGTGNVQALEKPLEGCQQAGGAVDGEHPQGSVADKPQIPSPQGMQRSEQDLHTPAAQSAKQEVPAEGFKRVCDGFCYFHGLSI